VALETDEEILDRDGWGIQWLLKNQRPLIDAEFALNEGGGVGLKNGKPIRNSVQTSEKVSVTFRLEVKDRGGHSSVPRTDNAIYHLADGLARLAKFNFPLNLNATTRVYFEETAKLESTQTAADIRSVLSGRPEPASLNRLYADPAYNAQLHTTCVATMLQGGHAYNALPQTASAMVNCRVMPGEPIEGVRATLARVLADERISLNEVAKPVLSMPSALNSELSSAIQKTSDEVFPGVPVVPIMSAGATDGSYLRNAGIPTYGHSGLASDVDDVRAHGQDERVARASFFQGQDYLYRLVKRLAGPQAQ
jgi:acetylornithine deacetylase/succinyl-diaminopimelate desuccinylase-like protein